MMTLFIFVLLGTYTAMGLAIYTATLRSLSWTSISTGDRMRIALASLAWPLALVDR